MVTLTPELIERLKSARGGYTRATMTALGVEWPLQGGWRRRLAGRTFPADLIDRLTNHKGDAPNVTTASGIFAGAAANSPKIDGVLFFDGSCWPNPGPNSQCGFKLHVGSHIIERTIPLGTGTNNTAEYHGIIEGMRAALEAGVTHLEVYGDSQLVIRGVASMKPWRKGKPHLEALKAEAQDLARKFTRVEFNWVPREQNADADALSTANV